MDEMATQSVNYRQTTLFRRQTAFAVVKNTSCFYTGLVSIKANILTNKSANERNILQFKGIIFSPNQLHTAMKTLFQVIAASLILGVSVIGQAQEAPKWAGIETPTFQTLTTSVDGTSILKVHVNKNVTSRVRITMKDNGGTVIASQQMSKHEYQKLVRFDLSQLPAGKYSIVVSDREHTTTKTFRKEVTTLAIPLTAQHLVASN